jgi:poly(beta-D-mannuronate) lyase
MNAGGVHSVRFMFTALSLKINPSIVKILFLTISLLSCAAGSLYATVTKVTSASQIAAKTWNAGDTIEMQNGTWSDQKITVKGQGTAAVPVLLKAQTAGGVVLSGASSLSLSGKYVIVSGLYFKDGTLSGSDIISFRTSSTDKAENCRLTQCAIIDSNPSDNTVDSKWVSLYGKNNQVDHCSFQNKTNSGTLMVVWLESGVVPAHIISQNYFGYRNSNLDANGDELNGQEIIRVGDSSTSMQTASVTVSGNYFEHCNGEIETISNKSCGNLYTNNLFFECKGMLTLRHGNGCTVEGNYFFGNGVSESGGVRIIGESHTVVNNYFDNLRGTGYRAALCVVRGKENSALNEYFQVKNATVIFNTFVNCSLAFNINYNSSSTCTMPPVNSVIAHNHVYNTSSSNNNITVAQTDANMSVTWTNNLMNQGKYSNFTYSAAQVVTGKNAMMALAGTTPGMYEPGSGSSLAGYTTSDYGTVTSDIRGRSRSASAKLPGASEITGTVSRYLPDKLSVGAAFFNNPASAVVRVPYTGFSVVQVSSGLRFSAADRGEVSVHTLSGQCLFSSSLQAEIPLWEPNMFSGLLICRFQALDGRASVVKLIVK